MAAGDQDIVHSYESFRRHVNDCAFLFNYKAEWYSPSASCNYLFLQAHINSNYVALNLRKHQFKFFVGPDASHYPYEEVNKIFREADPEKWVKIHQLGCLD